MPQTLRANAEILGQSLPPLLASAEHLAATILLGAHGRKRAGNGDEFWQYRPAHPGDEMRRIDWRRSGRSDGHFVREREWQAAQSVTLWVDAARSMHFTSTKGGETKAARAQLLALALAVLLLRGGERVGLAGDAPPRSGRAQLLPLLAGLGQESAADYGCPNIIGLPPFSRAVFVSDFMGDPEEVETALAMAVDRGVQGALVQVLDPAEQDFPYDGRTIFQSMGGTMRHETLRAKDLRTRYLDRLAERKDRLQTLARAAGWHYLCHNSAQSAQSALLWLYAAMETR